MENLAPILHNLFAHADVVEPLAEHERSCLEEIRQVLAKHGKLDRFGITLLHKHFEIAEDEILMETTDEITRTQIIRPVKKVSAIIEGETLLETCWILNNSEAFMACKKACVYQDNKHYSGSHTKDFN